VTVLTFVLESLQPLLVTRLEGDPNSSVSYPYLPASALRGALAARRLHGGADPHADGDDTDRRLFFDGRTRFLNAYPLDRRGRRGLPAPLAWYKKKEEPLGHRTTLYDFSVEAADDLEQPEALGERFCCLADDEVEFIEPKWQINVHTARARVKGRATREEGAVFRYQALAADQRFAGAVLTADAADAALLQSLLEEEDLWLGGSRSAGYGRACVVQTAILEDWSEIPEDGRLRDLEEGDHLTLTLLSDSLLRDATGAWAGTLAPELLPEPVGGTLEAVAAYKKVIEVGGFNRKWGLPLPQAYALQAGSVFVFRAKGRLPAAELRRLEEGGIGLRRVEGFGRMAANWHAGHAELRVVELEPSMDSEEVSLNPQSQVLAGRMLERLLRRELDRRLHGYIYHLDLGDGRWPSNAQLSRLRGIALNALPERNVKRLGKFLKDLKPAAREQFRAARVEGGVRLLDWLEARLDTPQEIWNWLAPGAVDRPEIGGLQAELTEELAREYTLRLVAGVLHRAGKERAND
jgi:CRISPR-associated protein Csx10